MPWCESVLRSWAVCVLLVEISCLIYSVTVHFLQAAYAACPAGCICSLPCTSRCYLLPLWRRCRLLNLCDVGVVIYCSCNDVSFVLCCTWLVWLSMNNVVCVILWWVEIDETKHSSSVYIGDIPWCSTIRLNVIVQCTFSAGEFHA